MDDVSSDQPRVVLETGEAALSRPQFIIAHDGRYYLTLAVWEYDPNHPGITDAQRAGVAAVADQYARLAREGWTRGAVELPHVPRRIDHDHGGGGGGGAGGGGSTSQHTSPAH